MRNRWGIRLAAVAACAAVVGALLAPPVAAHTTNECPAIMPVSELRRGMIGTGETVAADRTIGTFSVEILGVIPDGIGPGRDMIIVNATSDAIDAAGGIWFGMSGSPVYIDGKLIGAVAFGLSAGPSSIGGLTPAQDMVDVLSYPAAPAGSTQFRSRVRIPDGMRSTIAARAGMSESEVTGMRVLRLPLSLSGVNGHGLDFAGRFVASKRLALMPHAGGSASIAPSQPAAAPHVDAGSSFAAALSYGDITAAGVGTTTLVCQGQAMAFGHPFLWSGAGTFGANAADAVAIVDDPLFGPYKLATIGESLGVVDQDRFAGIRAALGAPLPPTIPITSSVFSTGTNRSRTGRTDVVFPEFVPFLGFVHMLVNIDFTIDRIGEGSSGLTYRITGTREGGAAFELGRTNLYTSEFDISSESLFDMLNDLFILDTNTFEDVEFTGIDVTATVEDEVKLYEIEDVLVSTGGGEFEERRRVFARPGQRIDLRVVLSPLDSAPDRIVDLSVRVPRRAQGEAFLEVTSGRSLGGGECFFEEGCFPGGGGNVETFDELLESLAERPRNNELLARLFTRGARPKSEDSEILDQVVNGFAFIRVRLDGGCCVEGKVRG